ncbi:MAG TPA: hypothetical protein EYP48_01915 [Ignisphaera sp.]|uniref:Uncharacterized protein n=1 Tax=Ignisphaera aggregans TaxID=334771 RepID=A0A832Z149_9CREN|nr:hypothetical protein [Ignisphaera sp.]HIP57511.1 hypothetical protein [Ignisphaera aggregans]
MIEQVNEVIKKLELAVNRHSMRVKQCKKALREYRRGAATDEDVRNSIAKLLRASKAIRKLLEQLNEYSHFDALDGEASERLHLLAFFISEVSVNEELELWHNILTDSNTIIGVEDLHAQLEHLEQLRQLAHKLFDKTKR